MSPLCHDPLRGRLAIDEADDVFVLRAKLPSLDLATLRILSKGVELTMEGCCGSPEIGGFCRTIRLTEPVSLGHARARYEYDILLVTLPKTSARRFLDTALASTGSSSRR
jgi:HSP20 family molecular chaperone IbpA